MRCSKCKCNGLMIFERFMGGTCSGLPWTYEGWRCIRCGDILDPLILVNRMEANKPAMKDWASSEMAA